MVSAVEARLTDKSWRDELVRRMSAGDDKSLILVSEIDPMYWLQGRQATLETASTEIVGWANALARFKKARFKIPAEIEKELCAKLSPENASVQPPDGVHPKKLEKSPGEKRALKIVLSECRWTDELAEIGKGLDLEVLAKLSQAQIIEHILDEAEAYYRKIWSLCSEEEKLVLIQLAEEGLVNPRHFDVLRRLRRRRLVRTDGHIRLLNCSFEQFVREAEDPTIVTAWESPTGGAGSARVRVPLLVLATVATVLLLFTQQQLFDTMTGVMAAVLGATGALGSLATRFRNPFSKSTQP